MTRDDLVARLLQEPGVATVKRELVVIRSDCAEVHVPLTDLLDLEQHVEVYRRKSAQVPAP